MVEINQGVDEMSKHSNIIKASMNGFGAHKSGCVRLSFYLSISVCVFVHEEIYFSFFLSVWYH